MKTPNGLFPGAELLERDGTETQYQVTFERGSFWLDLPSGTDPAEAKLIFVFSGAGGVGKTNNLSHPGPASEFRRSMIASGFGFVCAVCAPYVFGAAEATDATLAAADHCRSCGLNVPERIAVLGFSMGGLGALMFAVRHPEKTGRVAEFFGITDLEEFYRAGQYPQVLGKLPPEERAERAPRRYADRFRNIPVLILHGDRDEVVDISHSEQLYAALKEQGCPVRFEVIPGYGHTNDMLAAAGGSVKRFMEE